jgi:hypothetical protein
MINIKIDANWKPSLEWLEQIKKGTGDARPLWIAMIPKIREFVAFEFAGSNPNKWPRLNQKYLEWKVKHGFPSWIGAMSGKMKDAANEKAEINMQPEYMTWKLNPQNALSKKGYPYPNVFNWGRRDGKQPARPIFKSTVLRVNNFLRTDINNMEGGSRMSFTFKWLEKAVAPHQGKA